MSSDLTAVSTYGWYTTSAVVDELVPVSTFGWYFTLSDIVENPDIIAFLLNINRQMEINLYR